MVALDTGNCVYESVVRTVRTRVRTIEEIGARQWKRNVSSVIDNRTAAIHDTTSIPQQPKQVFKATQTLTAMTSERFLFNRLYIGSQQRDGDLGEFFMHKNQSYPPYSSQFGNLLYTKKFDLIECLTKGITETSPPESYDVTVVDGAALVRALQVLQ